MPPILIDILLLCAGLALLWFGGNALVSGSVTIAYRLGISPLVVGLTVVAFGTSAPELAFNSIAAAKDNDSLVFGNVVGSNICNIGLILGIAALLNPLTVHADLIRREIPVMIGAMILLPLLAHFGLPGDESGAPGVARVEGILLLCLLVVYCAVTVWLAVRERQQLAAYAQAVEEIGKEDLARSPAKAWLLVLLGLGLLTAGGQLGEWGAVGVARVMRIPDEVIGLTVVAIGTSLPELAASVVATKRGQVDVAVGNIVGSNIFNILFIFGMSATIAPVALPAQATLSLTIMCVFGLMLFVASRTRSGRVSRVEGTVLLASYMGYLGYQAVIALQARAQVVAGP